MIIEKFLEHPNGSPFRQTRYSVQCDECGAWASGTSMSMSPEQARAVANLHSCEQIDGKDICFRCKNKGKDFIKPIQKWDGKTRRF